MAQMEYNKFQVNSVKFLPNVYSVRLHSKNSFQFTLKLTANGIYYQYIICNCTRSWIVMYGTGFIRVKRHRHRWWPRGLVGCVYTKGMKRTFTALEARHRRDGCNDELIQWTDPRGRQYTWERSRGQTRTFHLTEQTRDKRPMEEVKRSLLCVVNQSSRGRLVPFTLLDSSGKNNSTLSSFVFSWKIVCFISEYYLLRN